MTNPFAPPTPRDPTADETDLLDFVDRTGKTVEPLGPPGFFHHFGQGLGTSAGQGVLRGVRAAEMMAPAALSIFGTGLTEEGQDWYYDNVIGSMDAMVDDWTPDAANVGAAGQITNGLVSGLIPLVAGPEALIGTTALDTSKELVDQGVDTKTAIGVGTASAVATAAGFKIPMAWGSNLATRLLTGAGGNLAIGQANREVASTLLDRAGNHELAEQYGGDGTAVAIDVGMGLAFGGLAHAQARRVSRAQQDAILTANNAHHFDQQSGPGTPVDSASNAVNVAAMETAVNQLLNGENVNLSDVLTADAAATFRPRQQVRDVIGAGAAAAANDGGAPVAFDAAVAGVLKAEGGYVNDASDRGGATKFGISSRAHPGVDVAKLTQDQARAIYKTEYWDAIGADQLPASVREVAFDAAVNQGVGWTRKALAEAGGDPGKFLQLREQRYRDIVANDPSQAKFLRGWLNRLGRFKETNEAGVALRERLVAEPEQLAKDYAALPESEGGRILNTDTARELSPEYLADRTRSADVHEAASDTIKTIYEAKLAQPTPEGFDRSVLFTAGGTGAGKTTAVRALGVERPPEIVYDTNMNTLNSAAAKVEQALDAGRDVQILYVYRDPVEALANGALTRAERQAKEFGSGRTVPLTEHARTHQGVRPVIEALAEKYKDDPRVDIRAFDNSRGRERGQFADLAQIPRVADNGLHERLQAALDEAHQAGRISDATHAGFSAAGRDAQGSQRPAVQGAGREPQPQRGPAGERQKVAPADGEASPYAAAANEALAELPDLKIADADGTVRSASEFLAETKALAEQADTESRAIDAAVNCFLRTGT